MSAIGLDLPAIGAPAPVPPLTGAQKAAIIVRLIVTEGIRLSLRDMPEPAQAELVRQIGALGSVDPATVEAVTAEFLDILEAGGIGGPAGLERALSLLGDTVSPSVAQRIRTQSGTFLMGDPWERIVEKEPAALVPVLESESVEVAAVLLSKLKVSKAAECLGLLPGERARRIAYAVSQTAAVSPDAVRRIGLALASVLEIEPIRAFDEGPVERVGAILNFSRATTRNEVLEGLEETDSSFAEQVRRAIFTFANIPERIAPEDVPKIVRRIDQDELVTALAAATGELAASAEFILGAMSKRMAEALRGEIEDKGEVAADAGETAMSNVVAAIREMESAGEIYLLAGED